MGCTVRPSHTTTTQKQITITCTVHPENLATTVYVYYGTVFHTPSHMVLVQSNVAPIQKMLGTAMLMTHLCLSREYGCTFLGAKLDKIPLYILE